MATANQIRQVAIEVKDNVTALKTVVDALKTAVDAIDTVTSAWTVNGLDAALPAELEVKAQTEAYEALNTTVTKPSNVISDSIAAVKAAA